MLAGAALLFPGVAQAQLNESDTLLLQYQLALNGSYQSGNLKVVTLLSRLETSVAPSAHWALKTQNFWRYQAFYDRKSDHDFASRNFLYLGQRRRVYPFLMGFLSANFRRKVDRRYFVGPGLTWQLLRRPEQTMKFSAAAVYESTRFAGQAYNHRAYDGSAYIRTWRATLRLAGQHRVLERRLRVGYEIYVQPSLERADNFRWLAEQSLEMSLWKALSFLTFLQYSHENVVVQGVQPDDLIITFGLGWRGNRF